jgi:hypothetical protein
LGRSAVDPPEGRPHGKSIPKSPDAETRNNHRIADEARRTALCQANGAWAVLDEAIKARQHALLSADLEDQRALEKVQTAVVTATSDLAGGL